MKIDEFQKSVPKPINKSFVKNPITTLKSANNDNGNNVFHELSLAFKIVFL